MICLAITHPYRKAAEITAALHVDPVRCWDKGAARNQPDGEPLAGRHKETYWRADFDIAEPYLGLAKVISAQIAPLDGQQDFLRSLSETGGKVKLEVYWDFRSCVTEDELPVDLMAQLVAFGITLDLRAVYPED